MRLTLSVVLALLLIILFSVSPSYSGCPPCDITYAPMTGSGSAQDQMAQLSFKFTSRAHGISMRMVIPLRELIRTSGMPLLDITMRM